MSDFCDVKVLSVVGAVARLRVEVVHRDVIAIPTSKSFAFVVMLDLYNSMRRHFLHGAQPCSEHEAYELTETHPCRARVATAFGLWRECDFARLMVAAHEAVADVRLEERDGATLVVTMHDPAWLWHLRPGIAWSTDARDIESNLYDVCRDANIAPEQLREPVEHGVRARMKQAGVVIEATADLEDMCLHLLQGFVVVSAVADPTREVALDEVLRAGVEADPGDEVLFHLVTLDRRLEPRDPPVAMPPGVEPLRGVARDLVVVAAADAAREAIVGVLRAALRAN